MKTATHILSFTSIGLLSFSTLAIPADLSSISPQSTTFDIKQLNYKDLDNSTIQWDYQTNSSISLFSSDCTNPNFTPEGNTMNRIRLLIHTDDYQQAYDNSDFYFGLNITCTSGSNSLIWSQPTLEGSLHDSIPYTRITIETDQCKSGQVSKVQLLADPAGEGTGNPITLGDVSKTLSYPASCSAINNFKIVYWPDLPTKKEI